MAKRTIDAPPLKAVGPYSLAVEISDALFLSGQIALDPTTGTLVSGDIKTETGQVLENLETVLSAAGLDLADIVKATVFLVDMADFAAMNEVYGARMPAPYPARSTIAVAALPLGARVEIEAIAHRGRRARPASLRIK